MKVTTLIENRPNAANPALKAEWGLSLYINFNGHNILFDAGKSGAFADNATHLSINLETVDIAILSHHHFDHGDGLQRFLEINPKTKVHMGVPPGGECFTRLLVFMKRYVGLEHGLLTDFAERFITLAQPTEILPDVFVFPHITGSYPRPAGNNRLFVRKNGKLIPDDFSHEIVLAIKEKDQLAIFTGCSHNGILNMVDTAARKFTGVPIKAVVGGMHLIASPLYSSMAGSKYEVEQLANGILSYPVAHTYTGHCTGGKAFAVLKPVMGDRLTDLVTGLSFEL